MEKALSAMRIDPERQQLVATELPPPACAPGQVRIRPRFAGVNRADLLQVEGRYPLPEEQDMVPGLEVAGEVDAVGEGVTHYAPGDRVCALLEGGGYAGYALADARHCLPVPDALSFEQAAALPEALATAWYGLIELAELQPGETVLIHGGSSGIGHLAIQLARHLGAQVITTVGSVEKQPFCEKLGAQTLIYTEHAPDTFAASVKALRDGGVDVILDVLGGDYIAANLSCLRYKGRLVSIACMQGGNISFNMAGLLMKNLRWYGMTLRSQSPDTKAAIITAIQQRLWGAVAAGQIVPYIDSEFTLADAVQAHERMHSRQHQGKILLRL